MSNFYYVIPLSIGCTMITVANDNTLYLTCKTSILRFILSTNSITYHSAAHLNPDTHSIYSLRFLRSQLHYLFLSNLTSNGFDLYSDLTNSPTYNSTYYLLNSSAAPIDMAVFRTKSVYLVYSTSGNRLAFWRECPQLCTACLDNMDCTSCVAGWFINPATKRCDQKCDPRCQNCTNLTSCGLCLASAVPRILNSSCSCPAGHIDMLPEKTECQLCPIVECVTCANATSCSVCIGVAGTNLSRLLPNCTCRSHQYSDLRLSDDCRGADDI